MILFDTITIVDPEETLERFVRDHEKVVKRFQLDSGKV